MSRGQSLFASLCVLLANLGCRDRSTGDRTDESAAAVSAPSPVAVQFDYPDGAAPKVPLVPSDMEALRKRGIAEMGESIGVETMGGVMTPFILGGNPVPAEYPQTFSTAHDNQDVLDVNVVAGDEKGKRITRRLFRAKIVNIPKRPRGVAQIAVVLRVAADGVVTLTATGLPDLR